MASEIPRQVQKKLLRLISARTDMNYSLDAYSKLEVTTDSEARYSHFLAFVVSYCRPFTENHGIGNLALELPGYPHGLDLEESDLRHQRMMDLRHKFLSHSSIEGTKVVLLAPGAVDPGTGEVVNEYTSNIARREFLDQRFADWLVEIVRALKTRLDELIQELLSEAGPRYLGAAEVRELATPADNFRWSPPERNGQRDVAPNA